MMTDTIKFQQRIATSIYTGELADFPGHGPSAFKPSAKTHLNPLP